ncbi:hypothetical protein ASZ90_015275 [hydrocarbon metagenome]|uniref:Uncharacterized protein n=1 Tax=hydrocarbon metagenome TaxID=938273 RepID=A0A0W8F2E0_9ZZZZ
MFAKRIPMRHPPISWDQAGGCTTDLPLPRHVPGTGPADTPSPDHGVVNVVDQK